VSYLFTGGQVVELAMQIERNGAAFYEAARMKAGSDAAKKLFDYLIGEEQKHLRTFREMLKDLELVRPREQYEGEWGAYLGAAAAEHVFTDDALARSAIDGIRDERQAIQFAIGFEKDSILLFYELSNLVEGRNKAVVEKLVNEEREHLRKLSELKKSVA